MKALILAVAVSVAALVAPAALAQGSTSGTFNVNVTLNSACSLSTPPADVSFTYSSFQPGVANAAGGAFSVSCSNGLTYTFGLEAGNAPPTPPGTATINVTDDALNLAYQLGTSAAGGTGSGLAQNYNITGTMAAGQGGNCAAASCNNAAATNRTHTLIVNY